ncbi:MAG: hypothetical protein JOY61_22295 [Chloroflexi bacterium]|nr:hypothetical protein [Chloroflexota bacterium]
MSVLVVNMIPASLSGETNQDSEPNIAVNPADPTMIVGTAFTPAPSSTGNAPIYLSTDGGQTWSLRFIVPGHGQTGTRDISVAFADAGGTLYAGALNGSTSHLNVLRASSATALDPMTILVDRSGEDQPWVVAATVTADGAQHDRVYVGSNNIDQPDRQTATVDLSLDGLAASATDGFAAHRLEQRTPEGGQDGPQIRIGVHSDGTVYAAHECWTSLTDADITFDVVVTRDDSWGSGQATFAALLDSTDQLPGQRVATNRFARLELFGQQRLGCDLAIAVDPTDSSTVWLAWCDRVGGSGGTDWTLHVVRSTDRGQSWSDDVKTVTNAKNPALAVNSDRVAGLLYQQLTDDGRWTTTLELSSDAWGSEPTTLVLHSAPSATPAATNQPYLGDYVRMIAVGSDFYGVFSGSNAPNKANFPNDVSYQRNANWATHTLLNTDNLTPVRVSIDPFFFHWSPDASTS